ncbi:MAG: hypothetical protein L6R37_001851 [Teloschistes peruensis]|nr:MAG: hypothetical protein L6R37_001851 [Teloschistes peruensis]
MSSPYFGSNDGSSGRALAPSPRLAPQRPHGPHGPQGAQGAQGAQGPPAPDDVSIRSMRLKVLYTFDHENKTNCLARWPHNIDIRTAYLDSTTQVGVIELKTCIQAIVAASPELVARLGQDYTVYAYDYSEYDTPLVGQGMLSWVLASSSSTPAAPAHQSKTMVTGRVCKNIMGLFSSVAQETLEVKLRLVPVPTCRQSDYIESMKSYRDLSRVMPEGFDAQAWTNFLLANPSIMQLVTQIRSETPAQMGEIRIETGIGQVQRLMHQSQAAADQASQIPPQSDNYSAAEAIAQLPRPASQASSIQSTGPQKRGRGRPPKPASERSGATRRQKAQSSRRGSFDIGYASNDDQQDELPTKKRAKVTQTSYPGSSDFGKQPELRVAASAAASVRIHQPTAIRPLNQAGSSLEGPPREPTPIAQPQNPGSRPLLPTRKSALRCESFGAEEPHYVSPYPPSDAGKFPTPEGDSPEGSQAEASNTPAEFASSPPVFHGSTTANSSPRLPQMPREIDSGFMSEDLNDLFEDDEFRPLDADDLDVAAQYLRRPDLKVQPSSDAMFVPDSGLPPHSEQIQSDLIASEQAEKGLANEAETAPSHPPLNRTVSSAEVASSSAFSGSTARPSTLHRSQTWAGQHAHPSSDAFPSSELNESAPRGRSRNKIGSGSGVKRKEAIQSKLAESVANGEMPPFCENCGAIETPAWRKAWIKVHSGTPEHVVTSDAEGGILAWQTLQRDADGEVCLFRIVKRTLLPGDEDFTEALLCNPCGIWLHTRKCMRPEEVWDKSQGPDGGAGGSRKRSSQSKKGQQDSLPTLSTTDDKSDSTAFFSDGSSPMEANDQLQSRPSQRPRASSVQAQRSAPSHSRLNESAAAAALQRAIQSSPVQQRTVQQSETVTKDLTPRPTRRVLFPEQAGQQNGMQGKDSAGSKTACGQLNRFRGEMIDSADKENMPPQQEGDECSSPDIAAFPRSVTPTPSSKSLELMLKTPNRSVTPDRLPPTSGDFFSSAARALLRPHSTPKHTPNRPSNAQPLGEITPFTAQLNAILSDANASSPSHSHFDFPALPSLSNTPGRIHQDFNFADFDPQDLLSTDVPMASSPPVEGWFGVYEDPTEREGHWWNQYEFPGSSPPKVPSEKANARPALSVDENGRARVEISPGTKGR